MVVVLAIIIVTAANSTTALAFDSLKRSIKAAALRLAFSRTLRAEVTQPKARQPRSLDLNSLRKSRTKGRARVATIDRLAEVMTLEVNDIPRWNKVSQHSIRSIKGMVFGIRLILFKVFVPVS